MPADVFGERRLGNRATRAILVTGAVGRKRGTSGAARSDDQPEGRATISPMGHRMRRRELMLLLGGAMTAAGASHAQQTAMSAVGELHPTSPDEQTLALIG
jgi:hypothetical protein